MREIDPALEAEIASGTFRPVAAVVIDWPEETVRMHSRAHPFTYEGETFLGVGDLGSIEGIGERPGLAVREMVLTFKGLLEKQVAQLSEARLRNRRAEVFIGAVDERGQPIGKLIGTFRGNMRSKRFEVRRVDVEAVQHWISITVQNFWADIRRQITIHHTHPRLPGLRKQVLNWPD
ncbi:MAG: hypothetical protein AAF415_02265 [Pseudomonadota bacterium]